MNCPTCHAALVQQKHESPARFAKRKYCSVSCRVVGMVARVRELDAQKVEVPCSICGAKLLRGRRRVFFVCRVCAGQRRDRNSKQKLLRDREYARRYRILMTSLGWDDFEELRVYLRSVPWADLDGRRVRDLRGAA
jgi:endogenous inhibitor of DNA gyrase (YacG/DUF329 family)